MKVRMELSPDEPLVAVINIPDDKVTPEMRARIKELGDELPIDTDELPFGLGDQIDWNDVTNIHWCVDKIEIKKLKSSTG